MKHVTHPAVITTSICAILGAVASWSVSRGIAPLWVIASALVTVVLSLVVAGNEHNRVRYAYLAAPIAVILSWYLQPDHPAWFPLWTVLPVLAWTTPRMVELPETWHVASKWLPYALIIIAWLAGGVPIYCLVVLLAIPATLRDDTGIEPVISGITFLTIGYLITGITR